MIILGTTDFTLALVKGVLDTGRKVRAIISMPEKPLNPADLEGFAKERGIAYHEVSDLNMEAYLLKSYEPEYILSSWPKIIKPEILSIPKYFIGTHPTDLPHNRGRHPLHWLIALGIPETKLTFYRMDEGIDTGNILLQIPIRIEQDTIATLGEKVNMAGYEGARRLLTEGFRETPQDHSRANYWRKRTPHDVTIDFRMSCDAIIRLVGSYSLPYPCAKLIFEDYEIPIEAAYRTTHINQWEHGRIVYSDNKLIIVQADDGCIALLSTDVFPLELLEATHIHPPSYYLERKEDQKRWGGYLNKL